MSEDIQNEIRIKLSPETIGKIDVLIESELYKDRINFLENAINQLLEVHQTTINNYNIKNGYVLGIVKYSSKELEKYVADGKKLHIKVIGGLVFDNDVSPELIDKTIEKINIAGILRANDSIKIALENKSFSLLGRRKQMYLKGPSKNILDWNDESDESK